jgi:Domain of Unknown function (DUF542)
LNGKRQHITKGEYTMDAMNRRDASATVTQADVPLSNRLIRDLVDAYPATLAVLDPLGIDLCCGGGYSLGEALDLHGIDRETVLPRVASIIAGSSPGRE